MKKLKESFFRNLKGTILPTAALLIVVILPLCGLTVDISYFGILRSSLEKATEASAVAGAQKYFRSMADAGRAVNETIVVFKMNVTEDTTIERYYSATGAGRPATLTYSQTFTQGDSINQIYRGQPVSTTVTANRDQGSITVTSQVTPNPFFAQIFTRPQPIIITKEARLPPQDLAFVFDLSGSMRFATVGTYIGSATREIIGMPGSGMMFNDVILYEAQWPFWGTGTMINANGYTTTIDMISDIVINTPGYDIPTNAVYDNGRRIYINDPKRGFITNTENSQGLRCTALTGMRISEIRGFGGEPSRLAENYDRNRSNNQNQYANYFDRAANQIEPHASAVYGVMTFIDTVRVYGTAGLNLGLVTFSTDSFTRNVINNYGAPELKSNGQMKTVRDLFPYVMLVEPRRFNNITDVLTVMVGGIGGNNINLNSYSNGATNIVAGLRNAKATLDRSARQNAQQIIILFTDGEPTAGGGFNAVGSTVRDLVRQGVTIHSVVLTLAVSQNTINQFRNAIENNGGQPVIFIDNPAQLDEAFLQIADSLGLRLVN